jgi:hypothetical protein
VSWQPPGKDFLRFPSSGFATTQLNRQQSGGRGDKVRDYGKTYTSFWTNAELADCSRDARLLGVYLLSSPHTNMIGCFRLPVGYVAEDLHMTPEEVKDSLAELEQVGYINYDQKLSWVLLPRFLRWNQIENQNQAKSALKLFDEIPQKSSLHAAFRGVLAEYIKELPESVREPFNQLNLEDSKAVDNPSATVTEPSPNPFERVSEGFTQPFRNQEQEQEQEQKQEGKENPPAPTDKPAEPATHPPSGLTTHQLASGLCEKLGIVKNRGVLDAAAQSISILAKEQRVSESEAMEFILQQAQGEEDPVTRFWFEDGRWRPQRSRCSGEASLGTLRNPPPEPKVERVKLPPDIQQEKGRAVWSAIDAAAAKQINKRSYETWIKPLRPIGVSGKVLYVKVPAPEFKLIGQKYSDLIEASCERLGLDGVTFVLAAALQEATA